MLHRLESTGQSCFASRISRCFRRLYSLPTSLSTRPLWAISYCLVISASRSKTSPLSSLHGSFSLIRQPIEFCLELKAMCFEGEIVAFA